MGGEGMNLCEAFKALGDSTRLRILALVSQRELCECQICYTLGLSQPNASKHLKCLRYAGLITCRKRSQWCFYSVGADFAERFSGLYDFLTVQWNAGPPYTADAERLLQLLRTKACCGMELLRDDEPAPLDNLP
jgi:ArsR family transcriptional regulator